MDATAHMMRDIQLDYLWRWELCWPGQSREGEGETGAVIEKHKKRITALQGLTRISSLTIFSPIAACSSAGTSPPVVFLVQGRMVREVTRRDSTALHVTMMVLVDMQLGPVNLEIAVEVEVTSSQLVSSLSTFQLSNKLK